MERWQFSSYSIFKIFHMNRLLNIYFLIIIVIQVDFIIQSFLFSLFFFFFFTLKCSHVTGFWSEGWMHKRWHLSESIIKRYLEGARKATQWFSMACAILEEELYSQHPCWITHDCLTQVQSEPMPPSVLQHYLYSWAHIHTFIDAHKFTYQNIEMTL